MFIVYTTLVFLNAHLAFSRQEWIDPHDMNIKSTVIPKSNYNPHADVQQSDCPVPINFSISHYKRLINLILSAAVLDQSSTYKGHLHINIPIDSYNFLKDFANDNKDTEDSALFRKVDQILSKVLVKPFWERGTDFIISWTDHIYFTFYNRTTLILLSCVFVLFISYKLLRADLTIWSVVKYLIFLGWVTDFAFSWINLLQVADINKMADSLMYESMPPHCNPSKMTMWQYLKYSMGSTNECRTYHQAMYKDNFWSVAPVTVLSHQLGVLIYTPASHMGQALGSFTSGLLTSLPWGVNIILLPVLLIFSAVILCILFSFITQTSFGFNFLHVLQLEFGNEQRRTIGDVLSGQNLNALLNIVQRNMIEEVRPTENLSKNEDSNCSNAEGNDLMIEDKVQNVTNVRKTGTDSVCADTKASEGAEKCKPECSESIRTTQTNDISNDTPHDGSGDAESLN